LDDDKMQEYVLHSTAVVAARQAAGLEYPEQTPDDPWSARIASPSKRYGTLDSDDVRLAIELTSREKRAMWGIAPPDA
jgi:hypothetical protein